MKLHIKHTVLVGFAFFLICAFWQAYDTIVPLILTNKFQMNQTTSGAVMALDNIFAVFLLPLFGTISDRTKSRLGRRTPYIAIGTLIAAVALSMLGFANSISVFMLVLLVSLLAMASFRSPAVALMPDVTVKPLRSKGNAIINLMGTAGGIVILVFAMIFHTDEVGKTDFRFYLIAVAGLMLLALFGFLFTVKEPQWAQQMQKESAALGVDAEEEERKTQNGKLTTGQRASLLLILASVALWYIGYNAVISKYSVYATDVLGVPYSTTLLIAQAAAVVSYIPVAWLSSRFGRRKMILVGVALLFAAFAGASFVGEGTPALLMTALFSLAGIAWATINVNSFPMVVEMANGGDAGKFTGYYYTASMAAQIITPVFSGFLMDKIGMRVLFPYAAIFAALAFCTMLGVRHGDSKPNPKKGILENLNVDD